MSEISTQRAKRKLARRTAIFVAIILAATAAVFALNATGVPAHASVRPFGASSHSAKTAATSSSSTVATPTTIAVPTAKPTTVAKTIDPQKPAGTTLNVWTTGFQTQINECHGGVDVTAHYGPRTIAEHWQCGGASFPETAGSIVTLTGLDAGTYRVIGLVATLDAYTAHTSQIPRGYDLLFQTCGNGNSQTTRFVALQKLG